MKADKINKLLSLLALLMIQNDKIIQIGNDCSKILSIIDIILSYQKTYLISP